MANDTGHSLTFTQYLVVLSTAMFGGLCGGMALGSRQAWPLVVSLVLGLACWLLWWLFRRASTRDSVRGLARVLSVSPPPDGLMAARCDLRLLVDLPGRPPGVRRLRDPAVYVAKWPSAGMVLPVEVPRDNPRRLRVLWTIVPDILERSLIAQEHAAKKAEAATSASATDRPSATDVFDAADAIDAADAPPAAENPEAFEKPESADRSPPAPPRPPAPSPAPSLAPLPRRRPAGPGPMPTQRRPEESGGPDDGGMDVMLLVSDLDASLGFYRDLLGLEVVHSNGTTALLRHGDGQILLEQRAGMPPVDRRVVCVYIKVADLPAVHRQLRGRNAVFAHRPKPIRRTDRRDLWVATLHDPDGHAIGLAEWRDRPG